MQPDCVRPWRTPLGSFNRTLISTGRGHGGSALTDVSYADNRPHGHVAAVIAMMRKLELPRLLGRTATATRPSPIAGRPAMAKPHQKISFGKERPIQGNTATILFVAAQITPLRAPQPQLCPARCVQHGPVWMVLATPPLGSASRSLTGR